MAKNTTTDATTTDEVEVEAPTEEVEATATPEPKFDVKAILASHVEAVKAVRAAEAKATEAREALALVIRTAREDGGETRPPVAKRAGITIAQLAGIELGRAATRDELAALGQALNIEELADLA